MKKYLKLAENSRKSTDLEIHVYYSKGGMNYFTSQNESRGYYLSVTPVERWRGMIGYVAFSGLKRCIKEVGRKSAKAEAEAERIAPEYEQDLINRVLQKNGLELA